MNPALLNLSDAEPGRGSRPLQARLRPLLWLLPTLALSLFVAYLLRFDGALQPQVRAQMLGALPWVVAIKAGAFLAVRITRSCHAFVSLPDAIRLLKATLAATACVAATDALLNPVGQLPRGVILIDAGLTALLIGGLLTVRRMCRERRENHSTLDG